jgi:hypothetical protein
MHYDLRVRTFALAPLALVACSSSASAPAEPPCVTGLSTACQATYDPPVFATIHAKILQPSCATGRGTCHTSDAAKGGLVLEDADASYAALLGQGGQRARVVPGDPSCSLIDKRLHSTDPGYHMPPGSQGLSAGDLCTITKWIAGGAAR